MSYIPEDINESVKKECRRRRLSPRTTKTYLYCINRFLNWSKKELRYISKKDVREFSKYISHGFEISFHPSFRKKNVD